MESNTSSFIKWTRRRHNLIISTVQVLHLRQKSPLTPHQETYSDSPFVGTRSAHDAHWPRHGNSPMRSTRVRGCSSRMAHNNKTSRTKISGNRICSETGSSSSSTQDSSQAARHRRIGCAQSANTVIGSRCLKPHSNICAHLALWQL